VIARRPFGEAHACRRPSTLERLGRALARPLGPGPLRAAAARALEGTLYLASGGRGLKCRLPEGEIVRVLPKYRHASWNLDEYRAFRRALAPGAVALDVGASVGSYALLFGQWVRPHGRVYAFEPAPAVRDALERHIALNGLGDVVVAVAQAVSDRTGRARFVTPGLHGISRLAGEMEPAPTTVDTITIDEFCERERVRPHLIKLDVEGAELAALRGARTIIRACRRDLALFVELHPSLWPCAGVTRQEFEDELAELRLRLEAPATDVDPWSLEGVSMRLRPL
jgi:FkbM family methyltransferase